MSRRSDLAAARMARLAMATQLSDTDVEVGHAYATGRPVVDAAVAYVLDGPSMAVDAPQLGPLGSRMVVRQVSRAQTSGGSAIAA